MGTVLARPQEKQFTTRRPSSCTRRCSVSLATIAENSSLLPPVGVWAVLNPSVAARPLRPATDRRPGEPLPHQLANRPQAPLKAPLQAFLSSLATREAMRSCPRFPGGIPHFEAGTHVLLTRPPLPPLPKKGRTCDLHVLGTPPAFILSQDQTRHASICCLPLLSGAEALLLVLLSDPRPSCSLSLFADVSIIRSN